jgi:hypothetical protein
VAMVDLMEALSGWIRIKNNNMALPI